MRMLWFSNPLLPVRCFPPCGVLLSKAAFEPPWHDTLFHTKNDAGEWRLSRWECNLAYCPHRNEAETRDFAACVPLSPGEHADI